ncbi:hypothetical protein M9H77_12779 [Catharanthus roseus]|uniref:Uncharacterized protein n=1 Tax=Catharanthus roseus TaxID=4058 RepID=A0ACC0BID5_CATRO|nr:hypothetical protein M9H77_12779 [Catharanthus roseus]
MDVDFTYNEKAHNVLQVNEEDYQSCNTQNPISTLDSGIDIVRLTTIGDYFFICGHKGHCQSGQKLHVSINTQNNPPSLPTPTPPSTPTVPTPFPPAANGESGQCPPYEPACNGGAAFPYHNIPGGYYPPSSSSSSLVSKWINNFFGAWIWVFLASYCGFVMYF